VENTHSAHTLTMWHSHCVQTYKLMMRFLRGCKRRDTSHSACDCVAKAWAGHTLKFSHVSSREGATTPTRVMFMRVCGAREVCWCAHTTQGCLRSSHDKGADH
jgi:hypothetical protein